MFKIKYGYKFEITNAWNDEIIWQHENVIAKTENGENILSVEVAVLISPM